MKLTDQDILFIKERFLNKYKSERLPPGGMPEVWFKTIMDFLEHKGLVVVKGEK